MEKRIRQTRIKSIIVTAIGAVFFPIYPLVSMCWMPRHILFCFFTSMLAVIVGAFILHYGANLKKEYRSLFKKYYVKKILDENFDDVVYDWKKEYPYSKMKRAHIIVEQDFMSEDYLKASYNGIKFEQADITCALPNYNSKSNPCEHVLYGKIMEITGLPVKVSEMQIYTNSFSHRGRYRNSGNKSYDTADKSFDNRFQVYARNKEDAAKILTPALRDKLMELEMINQKFALSFVGNKLYIAINTYRNTFDIQNGLKDIDFEKEKTNIQEDIKEIKEWLSIVDIIV